mgnify:CR=1 FL=1|tara:strand:- start:302 stop:937 length:636 start_codon:yes stop_codon:yes gene_type:complete
MSKIFPSNKSRFVKDFIVIQLGFSLFAFAIAIVIRANIGATSWAVLEVALAEIFGITPGTGAVVVGAIVLLLALLLREPIGWGTVANILSIGPWEDFYLWVIPELSNNFGIQIIYLCVGIVSMSIGSAIYIGVNAGAGPRDSLMMAIARTTPLDVRASRAIIEISAVLSGWVLGGPLGLGTVLFAICIGPGVQIAFRIFNMDTYSKSDKKL